MHGTCFCNPRLMCAGLSTRALSACKFQCRFRCRLKQGEHYSQMTFWTSCSKTSQICRMQYLGASVVPRCIQTPTRCTSRRQIIHQMPIKMRGKNHPPKIVFRFTYFVKMFSTNPAGTSAPSPEVVHRVVCKAHTFSLTRQITHPHPWQWLPPPPVGWQLRRLALFG